MKKLIAILLASMLVACCFAVSASADSNLVAGSTNYTLTSDDEVVAYNSAAVGDDNCPPSDTSTWFGLYSGQVTDGAVRSGTEDSPIASDAVMGTTVELTGSLRTYTYTFDLEGEHSVSSIVVRLAKIGGNRSVNVVAVKVSDDNATWTDVDYDLSFEAVANATPANPGWGTGVEDLRDQFFNITASFETVNASYISISLNTTNPDPNSTADSSLYGYNFYVSQNDSNERGYIVSFDEIEVYGGDAIADAPVEDSEDAPVEESEAPVVSEDAPVEESEAPVVSEDAPVEESEAPVVSEDAPVEESEEAPVVTPSESEEDNTDNETPSTGDAGLAVFAVLAVVSMAGVVVAKKVK